MLDSKYGSRSGLNLVSILMLPVWAVGSIVMLLSQNATGQVSLQDVLEGLAATEQSLPTCAMRVETRISREPKEEIDAMIYVQDLRWDGNRADVIQTRYSEMNGEVKQVFAIRNLWNSKEYQFRQQALKEGPGEIWAHVSSDGKRKEHVESLLKTQFNGAFLSGIMYGDQDHILNRLKDPTCVLQEKMEDVGGTACYVLEASPPNGHYKLWVDPTQGFNVRKAVIIRKPGDIMFGRAIRTARPGQGRQLAECRIEVDQIEIQRIGDRYVPTSGSMVRTYRFTDNTTTQKRWEARRSNIQLNPDFEKLGAFVMDGVPDGTRVVNEDFPGIRYIWVVDRAIIDFDLEAIGQIDDVMQAEVGSPAGDDTAQLASTAKNTPAPTTPREQPEAESIEQRVVAAPEQTREGKTAFVLYSVILAALCIAVGFFLGRRSAALKVDSGV